MPAKWGDTPLLVVSAKQMCGFGQMTSHRLGEAVPKADKTTGEKTA
jgi:hypothetical protein